MSEIFTIADRAEQDLYSVNVAAGAQAVAEI